jgi:hypothetical protein
MLQRKTKLARYFLIAATLLAVAGIVFVVIKPQPIYPSDLLVGCQPVPLNKSEQEHDVVAKFELKDNRIDEILVWYRNHGFNIATDSSSTNGYGPHGISFSIHAENQICVLVVSEWKDF